MSGDNTHRSVYQSYLLRLWRTGARGTWYASLHSTTTERMYHFATIEALFAFLDQQMTHSADTPPAEHGPPQESQPITTERDGDIPLSQDTFPDQHDTQDL